MSYIAGDCGADGPPGVPGSAGAACLAVPQGYKGVCGPPGRSVRNYQCLDGVLCTLMCVYYQVYVYSIIS